MAAAVTDPTRFRRTLRFGLRQFLLAVWSVGAILVLLEIGLLIYNPFEFRVRGDRIVLPVSKEYRLSNTEIPGLDPVVIHRKNSLGFRGPELPSSPATVLKIITVGGSTTECFYASDGKTWTDVLGGLLAARFQDVWINNAGLDGQSTFGHLVLMDDYVAQLRPDVVLFLVGVNDVGLAEPCGYDYATQRSAIDLRSLAGFGKSLAARSEVFSLALNLYRYSRAHTLGLAHEAVTLAKLPAVDVPEDTAADTMAWHRTYVAGYAERLRRLVASARRHGIQPVFLTQPTLLGEAIDPLTGVDLARVQVGGPGNRNGRLMWQTLELYNETLRLVAARTGVPVIDLARRLEKNSQYFYDFYHLTNAGNRRVAEIVFADLVPYLSSRFPEHVSGMPAS